MATLSLPSPRNQIDAACLLLYGRASNSIKQRGKMLNAKNSNSSTDEPTPALLLPDGATTVRVYQYGAVPLQPFPQEAIESLFQTNKLWNTLVDLHNKHRQRYDQARREANAEYALAAQSIEQANERVNQAYEAKRMARAKAGTKDASHPLLQEANAFIEQVKQARRLLWEQVKPLRRSADSQIDKQRLNDEFKSAVNAAQRKENIGPISPDSANQVADYFRTARDRAFKENTDLQFHAFDGTGFFFYRFRMAGRDGVPFCWLMHKGATDHRALVILEQRGQGRKTRLRLRAKIAGGRTQASKLYVQFDVILHRPLPENAQVQNAKLTRQRVGDRFKYAINFTCRLPQAPLLPLAEHALGVDIGFRKTEQGQLRAAMISGSAADDGTQVVEISKAYLDRLAHVDQIKARLDQAAAELGQQLKPLLKAGSVLSEQHAQYKLVCSIANLRANVTLSFEKAYKVARWCLREPGVLPAQAQQLILQWWHAHGRAYREQHNLRAKVIGSRKHLYRNIAAELVKAGRPIGVELIDLSKFAETKDADNKLGNTARANRFLAAPSELLGAIKNAAQREGVAVVEVPAAYTSKTCSACGHVNKKLHAEVTWTCQSCGTIHDRDANAAVNIAQRALQKLHAKPKNQ
jgi:ribosomal protein L37AE/L43A